MITNPIKLAFDPAAVEDATTKMIFEDQIARTLWLSWRTGHMVSQHFAADCWAAAKRLKLRQPPISIRDLEECLTRGGPDFMDNDIKRWAPDAIRFFDGTEELRWIRV